MKNYQILTFFGMICLMNSCNSESNAKKTNQLNGDFCSKIEYFSTTFGSSNSLNLQIEITDGYLTKIHWPKSAWLENLYLPETKITGDLTTFTDDKGRNFTIKILKKGDCEE